MASDEEIDYLSRLMAARQRKWHAASRVPEAAALADTQAAQNAMLQPFGELRAYTPPTLSETSVLPDPYGMVLDVVKQPFRAGEAVGDALIDPTIPKVTSAGMQTAMTVGRPLAALKLLGAGVGTDVAGGLLDSLTPGESQAAAKKTKQPASFANGFTQEELEPISQKTGIPVQTLGAMRRAKINEIVQSLATTTGAAVTQSQAEQERLMREEYDRQVRNAEAARDKELARIRRWGTSSSRPKEWFDAVGGVAGATAIGGAAGGIAGRVAHGGGTAMKNFIAPALEGAAGGFIAGNLPLLYDAYSTDVDNPEKAAYLAYARELPPGHPRKTEMLEYAKSLPDANPVRKQAVEEMYDPWAGGMRLAEGAAAGVFGANLGQIGSRIKNAVGPRPGGPSPGPQSPQPSQLSPPHNASGVQHVNPQKGPSPTPNRTSPSQRKPASKPLTSSERDAIFSAVRATESTTVDDLVKAFPSLAGKEAQVAAQIGRIAEAAKATGKRSRDKAFATVDKIKNAKLGVPLAAGGTTAAFTEALRELNMALVDLDGDGKPDAMVRDDLPLGDRYPRNPMMPETY